MKEKLKNYAKEIVIFFVIMTIFANIMSFYRSTDLNKESFSAINITLLDSKRYKLPQEKPLLVHFWATWCPTCKLEASNIEFISQNYEVLTVAVKSGTDEEIQQFLDENSLNFNVVNDTEGLFSSEYKIAAFPTTFIYDKDSKLVFSDVGYTSTWGLWLRMWWASL